MINILNEPDPIKTIDELIYEYRKINPKRSEEEMVEYFVSRQSALLRKVLELETNVPSKWDILIIQLINKSTFKLTEDDKILKIYKNRKN